MHPSFHPFIRLSIDLLSPVYRVLRCELHACQQRSGGLQCSRKPHVQQSLERRVRAAAVFTTTSQLLRIHRGRNPPAWHRGNMTPLRYVFDVTFIGQRSSPGTCYSVKVEMKFHLECKLYFPGAQLMLRQMHLTNVSESIEAKYWVSWLRFDV